MRRRGQQALSTDEQGELQATVLEGAAAHQLADFAKKVLLADHERAIRKRIFNIIDSEEALDPVKAAQAWVELRAVYKLIQRLENTAKAGEAAHKTLESVTSES